LPVFLPSLPLEFTLPLSFLYLLTYLTPFFFLSFDRFTGQVKLHSLLLRSSTSAAAPLTLRLFANRDDLDFGAASERAPTQTLTLPQTADVQEIPLKRALWNATRCITLFFVDNYGTNNANNANNANNSDANDNDDDDGDDGFVATRFSFLGFKGEWMPLSREPVHVLYEAAANPSDHPAVVGTRGMAGKYGAFGAEGGGGAGGAGGQRD
jgi:hypothetical protein